MLTDVPPRIGKPKNSASNFEEIRPPWLPKNATSTTFLIGSSGTTT
jgi:hypothetical protein